MAARCWNWAAALPPSGTGDDSESAPHNQHLAIPMVNDDHRLTSTDAHQLGLPASRASPSSHSTIDQRQQGRENVLQQPNAQDTKAKPFLCDLCVFLRPTSPFSPPLHRTGAGHHLNPQLRDKRPFLNGPPVRICLYCNGFPPPSSFWLNSTHLVEGCAYIAAPTNSMKNSKFSTPNPVAPPAHHSLGPTSAALAQQPWRRRVVTFLTLSNTF
jgi:hypothetical protein